MERLPRLPVANEKGRVGRQVTLILRCLTADGIFLTVDWRARTWMVAAGGHGLSQQIGGITSLFEGGS